MTKKKYFPLRLCVLVTKLDTCWYKITTRYVKGNHQVGFMLSCSLQNKYLYFIVLFNKKFDMLMPWFTIVIVIAVLLHYVQNHQSKINSKWKLPEDQLFRWAGTMIENRFRKQKKIYFSNNKCPMFLSSVKLSGLKLTRRFAITT